LQKLFMDEPIGRRLWHCDDSGSKGGSEIQQWTLFVAYSPIVYAWIKSGKLVAKKLVK
jgi:hypothetical protein